MSIQRWTRAVLLATTATLLAVTGTTNAAAAAPTPSAAPTLNLVVTGAAFGLANGESKTVRVTGTRTSAGAAAEDDGPAATATCYLGGELPLLIELEGLERRINFTASLRCDGVSGMVELTVGLQQAIPFGGGYVDDKYSGPEANPTPLIILGVNSDPKPCVQIGLAPWRGVAHPRLITDAVIYDFGWYPTYDTSLSC